MGDPLNIRKWWLYILPHKRSQNLYSDSSYVVNLLPHLPYAYIRLDANPISALMIQLRSLLKGSKNPIYIQHLRGHQNLPGLISQGNAAADAAASGACLIEVSTLPIQNATQMHDLTHVNWRGHKYLYPQIPAIELKLTMFCNIGTITTGQDQQQPLFYK